MLTVSVTEDNSQRLKNLAIRDSISSRKDYLEFMINYFEKTGINPSEKTIDLLSQLKKSENRIISFIKTQDKAANKHDLRTQEMANNLTTLNRLMLEFITNIQKKL